MDKLTLYDYLGFVLPGALLLATAAYSFELATPKQVPSAEGLVILTAAAFLVGHLNASLAFTVAPLAWGRRPGGRIPSSAGLFRKGWRGRPAGPYANNQRHIEHIFEKRFPDGNNFDQRLRLGYTLLRQKQLDGALQIANQQIGFYRNLAVGAAGCMVMLVSAAVTGHDGLDNRLWISASVASLVLCVLRFRHFWVRFGDEVVRGTMALDQT
jgi:hypothetical protein